MHISAKALALALALASAQVSSADEQTAIARLLIDMDDEIAAFELRREKPLSIKQGIMQQLLNGRVRLVPPSTATTEAATP